VDLDQYEGIALQACQYDGKQVGLPVLMDSAALIYNKDLIPKPMGDFADLLEQVRELTDAKAGRWGLVLPLLSQTHIYPFVDGYGGYLFRCNREGCDPGDVGLNNEGAVKGIQLLSDLYLEGLFADELVDRATMHDYGLRAFVEGRAAVMIDGPWVIPDLADSGVNYGVTDLPALPEETDQARSLTFVHAVYASAQTAHAEETVGLLNYLAGPEGAMAIHQALGRAPVRRDIMRQPDVRQNDETRAWYDQATNGVLLPNNPELDWVWSPWTRALEEAIPGLTPSQEALDRAVEEIVEAIASTETE